MKVKAATLLLTLTLGVLTAPLVANAEATAWPKYMQAGMHAYQQGRYAEAEKSFQAALKEAERFGLGDLKISVSLSHLAEVYIAQGEYSQVEPLLKRSLANAEQALGPEHPKLATILENYAVLLRQTNREGAATELEARAKAIRAKHAKENP